MVELPGLGWVTEERLGEPAVLRWLSIDPNGGVVEHRSDNMIGWSVQFQMWIQFRLLRDVYWVVDPSSEGFGPPSALVLRTYAHGVVVAARDTTGTPNRLATALLAAVDAVREVNGTAAWLGAQDPQTGFYADLERVHELRAVAAHCRTG